MTLSILNKFKHSHIHSYIPTKTTFLLDHERQRKILVIILIEQQTRRRRSAPQHFQHCCLLQIQLFSLVSKQLIPNFKNINTSGSSLNNIN